MPSFKTMGEGEKAYSVIVTVTVSIFDQSAPASAFARSGLSAEYAEDAEKTRDSTNADTTRDFMRTPPDDGIGLSVHWMIRPGTRFVCPTKRGRRR